MDRSFDQPVATPTGTDATTLSGTMSAPSVLQTALAKIRSHGLKYSAVSVVNVAIGQGLLILFAATIHILWLSNVLAVCLSAVPAYYLSRAWVWGKTGKSHLTKEVLPFWGFALAGLVLSTIAVALATSILGISGTPREELSVAQKLVPNIANMMAFGVLWVLKFFILDSFMFGKHHHGPSGGEVEPTRV
jgi:putative flippase GtrA